MSASNNKNLALGVVGLLALVGVAAYFFLGTDPGMSTPVKLPSTPESGKSEPRTEPDSSAPVARPIKTETFSAKNDSGASSATISKDDTGIRVSGVVLTQDGQPIESAEVALIRDVSSIRARSQDGETLARVKTGKAGSFSFDSLDRDAFYILQASHSSYTTERKSPIDTSSPATLRQEIRLSDGLKLSGMVTDAQNVPLADSEVLVYDMNIQTLDPVQEPERVVKTFTDGHYVIDHLAPGLKKILARKEGFSSDGRNALDVRPGQPLEAINFSLSRGFTLVGIVRDQKTGLGIKGAQLTARPINYLAKNNSNPVASEVDNQRNIDAALTAAKEGRHDIEDMEARRAQMLAQQEQLRQGNIAQKSFLLEMATTDQEGRFVLNGLMEARYMLQVRAEGYQPNNNFSADAGSEGHIIPLAPCARILGRVIDDDTGMPIPAFRVAVLPNRDAPYIPVQLWKKFKNPDGTFEYCDLRPGPQFVYVEVDGFAGGRSDQLQINNDEQISGIEVRAVRGATVVGFVKNSNGEPVPGVRVDLVQSTGGVGAVPDNPFSKIFEAQMRANGRKRAITDGKGRFSIVAVLSGSYKVKTEHTDYSEGESSMIECESRGEFTVPDVIIRMGATIRGFVKKKDGSPDSRATIMIANADPATMFSRSIQTGNDGRYEVRGLKAGSYRVTLTQSDGVFDLLVVMKAQQSGTILTIADGETKDVDL